MRPATLGGIIVRKRLPRGAVLMIPTIAILLIVAGAIAAFGMASWRGSEESYERWRSRRGEDEPRERFDDRGRCGAG